MNQETVNQRIEMMVENFCRGNKSAFAKAVGITSQSLGEIVGGRQSAPSFAALQKIALAYPSVSLHWLVLGEGPMFELTDENPAHKLERYADEVEDHAASLYNIGELTEEDYTISKSSLWELRVNEEVARVEFAAAIEREKRHARNIQQLRARNNIDESKIKHVLPSAAQEALALAEREYLDAVRNRIRAERTAIGFSTDSATAVYRLGEDANKNSLYGGLLAVRLNISNESAEELVKSGKIRSTYINGEGYRITEQAVRIFLGEF